jgi:chorismate mutase
VSGVANDTGHTLEDDPVSAATSDSATTSPDGDPVAPPALAPAGAEEIPALREEIDAIDAELLRLVKRRSEISQRIGLARMAAGGPRIVYNREMQVLARFRDLGAEGRELAMLLLRLGRGRLGGRSR